MTAPLVSLHSLETWMLAYLLNSLWQVPLVLLAAWLAASMLRPFGPWVEHRLWVAAMMLEVILPACHFDPSSVWLQAWSRAMGLLHWGGASVDGTARVVQGTGASGPDGALQLPPGVLWWITLAYASSLVYFAARLAWRMWHTSRLRRTALASPERWATRLQRMGARVAVSSVISGPSTVGFGGGVVLLPPALLDIESEVDLDAALAHECAHIERRDFAKNLAYQLLSLPVAYHPALWLTRSRIAETREMVCDMMAAETVRGRKSYARSLLRLASMMTEIRSSNARTIHAIGMFDANNFERRIMNLVEKRKEMTGARRVLIGTLCGAVALGTCASALALRVDVSAPATANKASNAVHIKSGDMAGNKISGNNPIYPKEAKASGKTIDGTVILAATISKDGVIEHLSVQKSLRDDYDKSALDAVRTWLYKPYLLNGEPVEVETTINITYASGG